MQELIVADGDEDRAIGREGHALERLLALLGGGRRGGQFLLALSWPLLRGLDDRFEAGNRFGRLLHRFGGPFDARLAVSNVRSAAVRSSIAF